MKLHIHFILAGIVLLAFQSCTTLVYTTASNVQPVTQVPAALEKKGDTEIAGGFRSYNSNDRYYDATPIDIQYVHMGMVGFDVHANRAVSDDMAIGLKYQFGNNYNSSGHGLTASFTHFRNYDRDRKTNQIGFDVLTGFAFETGPNIMSVDTVFISLYVLDDIVPFLYLDTEFSPAGYYKLDVMDIKAFVQPSFTFRNRVFELHFGGSMGYHYRHKYDPKFSYNLDNAITEAYHNPLVYYNSNKHFFFWEYFFSFGLGNENVRLVWTYGAGRRSDDVQSVYRFTGLGVRGRF